MIKVFQPVPANPTDLNAVELAEKYSYYQSIWHCVLKEA